MLWATAWTVLVTAVVTAWGGRAAAPPVFRESASFFSVRPLELGAWAATVLAGAAIAGALVGLLGRKLRARPWVRTAWLWLAFFPAAGLAGAFTLSLVGAGVALAAGEREPVAACGLRRPGPRALRTSAATWHRIAPRDDGHAWRGGDMFGWFKKGARPPAGPDFGAVDSLAKAQELAGQGKLEKLFLMPLEFGGADVPPNVVYVPVGAAAVKAGIDRNVVGPLAAEGKITRYEATPEYQGKSFVPIAIRIRASSPGEFTTSINLWGEALTRGDGQG